MSWAAQAVIAALIFLAGTASGVKWQKGVQAQVELAAADTRAREAARQIKVIDQAAMAHVTVLANINNQLGNAREKIATLSGRECFGSGTTRVLNAIADQSVRTAAGELEGEAPVTAPGGDIRYSTEGDAAWAIAVCRARYAEVSSQVNQILDIEEARRGSAK